MRHFKQESINKMVARETGFPEDLVEEVVKQFYKSIRLIITEGKADKVIIENFLKFYRYINEEEKERNNE